MTDPNVAPPAEIDRERLEQAIRHHSEQAGQPEPWTACRRPDHYLVLDRDGGLRACDHAGGSIAGADAGEPAAAWRTQPFVELRQSLREGKVPHDHCRGCRFWVAANFARFAPLARELEQRDSIGDSPTDIVVQLPANEDAASTRQRLSAALPSATRLVVDIEGDLSDHLEPWLEPARSRSGLQRIELRVRGCGDLEAARDALADLPIHVVELTLDDAGTDDIAAASELAAAFGATLRARFVVTPSNWFWFEHAAIAAADADIQLDWRVMDRSGVAPLAELPIADLSLIQDTVGSCAPRFEAGKRPKSVGPEAFESLTEELRLLLIGIAKQRIAEHAEDPEQHCAIVPLDHPWMVEPQCRLPLITQLFAHSHLPCVYEWVEAIATEQTLVELAWLRILSQKMAWEQRRPKVLTALRDVYADTQRLPERMQEDAAFEAYLELPPLGGPWGPSVGLPPTTRDCPIDIATTPAPPQVANDAVLTVLIPSYKHEAFIEGAIRSVLAQTSNRLRVLVCDDRSPDDTVKVARSIDDPRLEVRVNEQNVGLGNSVLNALESIQTPYVALLNSDDLFHPERIERCLDILEADPEVQVVTTGLTLVDQDGGELTPDTVSFVMDGIQVHNLVHWYDSAKSDQDLPKEEVFEHLLERNFLATSSNLTARTDWLRSKHEAFRNLKYCLDWQVFLEAALEGALYHVATPLLGYRLHASNTVWFDEDSRWAFYLEVNRVMAHAIESLIANRASTDDATIQRVTKAVAEHLAINREADGFALFLNSTLDGLALDRSAAASPPVREMVDRLAHRSRDLVELQDNEEYKNPQTQTNTRILDHYRYEQIVSEKRSQLAGIFRTNERLQEARERELRLSDRLDAQVDTTRQLRDQLQTARDEHKARLQDLHQRLQQTHEKLEARIAAARKRADNNEQSSRELRDKLDQHRSQLADQRSRTKEANQQLQVEQRKLADKDSELALASADNERLHGEVEALRKTEEALRKTEEALRKTEQEQERAISNLQKRRNQLVTEGNQLRDELQKLRLSREFRTGNFIWNKLPLNYMSRRAKKWYNRLVDAKNRIALWAGGKLRSPKAEGVAVVASCWHWPIYSHTFVYQEMLALTHMGLDVKMFHWAANDFDQLQPAFSYLKDNRVELKPNMKQHKKDRDHFAATKPGRLDALLERVSAATGTSVEELAENPQVLRGCTFARMAELANARYLHSYFFYDQSFMVLVASWLLDIPRGVSCYADHMMDDWPLKVVPLQLQMASVIVATSARIKEELVGLGGPEVADKIVVKPNGVNGERFPAIDRGERQPDEPFEVISISRLEPKKGLEYLIEAVAALKKAGRKIKVHIVGAVDTSLQASIDYGTELEEMIENLGLKEEVLLHGMMLHEQIQPIMQRCRAFVAPYVELESGDKDGIPTAMLEALASGLPIVTTDSGSILEVVQDGVQALVTPQRDSKAYGEALEKLIADPALERKLAQAARTRFDEEFDIKVTERRLHERVAATLEQPVAAR